MIPWNWPLPQRRGSFKGAEWCRLRRIKKAYDMIWWRWWCCPAFKIWCSNISWREGGRKLRTRVPTTTLKYFWWTCLTPRFWILSDLHEINYKTKSIILGTSYVIGNWCWIFICKLCRLTLKILNHVASFSMLAQNRCDHNKQPEPSEIFAMLSIL